jgi:transposase InsO family protein
MDFIGTWVERTEIAKMTLVKWVGISTSKYYDWQECHGQIRLRGNATPRDFWLAPWEKEAIVEYYRRNPLDGYRRLTYRMMDEDVVAVSPSTTYRVLSWAGLLRRWSNINPRKGKGFEQPGKPHEHWHVDIAYLNICGTFYYLISILDGYSRMIVQWEIRESMLETEVEIVMQRAKEKFPGVTPRIISDLPAPRASRQAGNGPQFIAREFKEFIRISGMTHVRTTPYYPQSNGKVERWHRTVKGECVRRRVPLSLEEARRIVGEFVTHYNEERLHGSIGYVTPMDRVTGRETEIWAERDRKLAAARERRRTLCKNKNSSPTALTEGGAAGEEFGTGNEGCLGRQQSACPPGRADCGVAEALESCLN